MKKIISLVLITLFFACSQDDYENSELNNSEFEPYINSFFEEAENRGYNLNIQNTTIYFADIKDPDIAGLCYQNGRIIIDRNNWNNGNEPYRERLIFHELGHCILKRAHRNEKSLSDECFSYMKGPENGFNCSNNLYSTLWRIYYLDELFDENIALPDWYIDNQEYNFNYNNIENLVSITNLNTNFYDTSFDLNNTEKFVIEFTFKDWRTASDNLKAVIPDIAFGGYFFGTSPLSKNEQIYINRSAIGSFFERNDYEFKTDIKLTIRKSSNLIQFFIDENFLHVMEVNTFTNNVISASFSELIDLKIKIFKYD
jgi:hypothetical protein